MKNLILLSSLVIVGCAQIAPQNNQATYPCSAQLLAATWKRAQGTITFDNTAGVCGVSSTQVPKARMWIGLREVACDQITNPGCTTLSGDFDLIATTPKNSAEASSPLETCHYIIDSAAIPLSLTTVCVKGATSVYTKQ